MKETGRMISGKTIGEWIEEYPIVEELCELKETVWINPHRQSFEQAAADCQFSMADIMEASDRLDRFAAYFRKAFPETEKTNGIIESPVKCIPNMKEALELRSGKQIHGSLWAKLDSHLAVSGSIKARGGIYEVLKHAEDIALENGMLKPGDSYEVFDSEEFRRLFSGYSIGVGSTGNLGLSIGIMSAKLGFKVTVHMSADARQWKKDMLRSKGVIVKEYESDYSVAVREGRAQAEWDPYCYFVDDENSQTLFMGYAVAALRLKKQLEAEKVSVDSEHPLFVYLPCGVGGGPGGVAFGLKMVFGDAVHCFFAEPVHSPCMILGMATGEDSNVSVQDFGIDNVTVADGLAVGRASGFVGSVMKPFMDGCYTLTDDRMFRMLALMADSEGIYLEPSALAGMFGALLQESSEEFGRYIEDEGLKDKMSAAVHMAWLTGGSMVPEDEMKKYYERGKSLL